MTVDPGGTGIAGTMSCPRCAAPVGPDQDWCLACGAAARTRLAPTPNWRAPVIAVAVVVLVAGLALAFAFVRLTGDDQPAPAATTAPPAATPAPPPATTAAPQPTVPGTQTNPSP